MGQEDILKVLEKYPNKWLSARDITKLVDISIGNVGKNLTKLFKNGFIERKHKNIYKPSVHYRISLYRIKNDNQK